MTIVRNLMVLFVAIFVLVACNALPNDGPLLSKIVSLDETNDNFVYGVIDLNSSTVKALEKHSYYPLSTHFGRAREGVGGLIGIGDLLSVTIFEAGPDGIFSTAEKKSVNVSLTVQENGRISIPFDGTVIAAGKTLEQVRRSIIIKLKRF